MNFYSIDLIFFDYIVLILTFIIIIFSFWKGFINSLLSLLTWVGSIFVTIYSYEFLSSYLYEILLNFEFLKGFKQFLSILSVVISIPLIFLLSLFIFKRIRKILSNDLDKQILGIILDKFFGIVYGIIFTYVVFSTLLFFTNNSLEVLNNINQFLIQNSNILQLISEYNNNIINIYNEGIENN